MSDTLSETTRQIVDEAISETLLDASASDADLAVENLRQLPRIVRVLGRMLTENEVTASFDRLKNKSIDSIAKAKPRS